MESQENIYIIICGYTSYVMTYLSIVFNFSGWLNPFYLILWKLEKCACYSKMLNI